MLLLVQVSTGVPALLDITRFAGAVLFASTVVVAVAVHPVEGLVAVTV
jgi:hypothetical protein